MPVVLSTGLPDLDLETDSTVIVDAGDPSAVITALTIHVRQGAPDVPLEIPAVEPLLGWAPTGGGE